MSELLKWLRDNNIVGFFLLLVFIGVVIATVYIMKWIHRFNKAEKACEKIPELENKVTHGVSLSVTIERKIDTQTERFNAISNNISALITFLTTKHTDLQSGLFQSFSPIQLTPIGIDVLEKSGGKNYLEKHISDLVSEMEMQQFKSALDVQNYATTLIINRFNTDDFIQIRNYIFQNPVYKMAVGGDISINSAVINQVMSIYLRDKYFEKYPALKDVDPPKQTQ